MKAHVVFQLMLAAMSYWAYYQWQDETPLSLSTAEESAKGNDSKPSIALPQSPLPQIVAAQTETLLQNNLFNQQRQYLDVTIAAEKAAAAPIIVTPANLEFALHGVTIDHERKRALLWDKNKRQHTTHKLGESLGAWKIVEIGAQYIKVNNQNQKLTLKLKDYDQQQQY